MPISTCIQFWFCQHQTSFTFAIIPQPPHCQPLPHSIHHHHQWQLLRSSLLNSPSLDFPQTQKTPPHFTHLLIQSNDPVLNKTHVIGDTVQFETYPDSCIFLGTKQTTPIDNGAQREYEAEFGVSRTRSSEHPPWHFISNFIIKSKEIIFASPSVFYHGNGSRISSRHKVGITHCQHPYISHLLSTKTSQMFDEKNFKNLLVTGVRKSTGGMVDQDWQAVHLQPLQVRGSNDHDIYG